MTPFPNSHPPQESTPTGLKSYSPGLVQQDLPWVGFKREANPVRVASISPGNSHTNDPTPSGLGRLAGLPRVATEDKSSSQPWAILWQPFQGCSAAAGMETRIKNLRHPERSEAFDLLPSKSFARAQSKDLADLFIDHGSAMSARRERPASRSSGEKVFRATALIGKTPRSFDCGSAKPSGETTAPLASAQDDGALKRVLSLAPQFHLGAPRAPRETLFRALLPSSVGSAMKLPQQARSQIKFGNERILLPIIALWIAIFAIAPTNLTASPFVSVSSLVDKDVNKQVVVYTNLPGMGSTGPLPPEGMETMTTEGLVLRGRLDSFKGDYLYVSMGYPNSTADNRKSASILKKAVIKIEVDR